MTGLRIRGLGLLAAASLLLTVSQSSAAGLPSAPPIAASTTATTQALRIRQVVPQWSAQGEHPPFRPGELSCGSETHCVALAGPGEWAAVVTDDGWITFDVLPLPPTASRWSQLQCSSAEVCTALSFHAGTPFDAGTWTLMKTTDLARTWVEIGLPEPSFRLDTASCWSDDSCFVIGSGAFSTTDGGATWEPATPPPAGKGQNPILYCIDGDSCLFGSGSSVYRTADGSTTWTTVLEIPFSSPDTERITVLDCADSSMCFMAAELTKEYETFVPPETDYLDTFYRSFDGGATWEVGEWIFNWWLGDVGCAADGLCVALNGNRPHVYPLSGPRYRQTHGWVGGRLITNVDRGAGFAQAWAVDCPAPATCYVTTTSQLWSSVHRVRLESADPPSEEMPEPAR